MTIYDNLVIIFYPRNPSWSAFVTTVACLLASWGAINWLTPDWFERVSGATVTAWQLSYWMVSIGVVVNVFVGGATFLLSRLGLRSLSQEWRQWIGEFDSRMKGPVTHDESEATVGDDRQAMIMAWTVYALAALLAVMILIPNSSHGLLAFVFCAGCVALVASLLWRRGLRAD